LVNQRRDHYQSALGSPTHCELTKRSLGGLSARWPPGLRASAGENQTLI